MAFRLASVARSITAAVGVRVELQTGHDTDPAADEPRAFLDGGMEGGERSVRAVVELPLTGPGSAGRLTLALANDLAGETMEALRVLTATAERAISNLRLAGQVEEERYQRKILSDALQETHHAMLKHRQVGRMGDFRYNTRTKESFGTIEIYWMFGKSPTAEEIALAKLPPYVIPLRVEFETWTDRIIPEDQLRVLETMQNAPISGEPFMFEYRIIVDGEVRHIAVDGALQEDHVGDPTYYGVMTDVTERRRSEERLQLAQQELVTAQRLASLGELAASIIHEVSQPITAIRTGAESCIRWLDMPDREAELRSAIDRLAKETIRASSVVGGLRALAKGVDTQLTNIDIIDAAREALTLVKSRAARSRVLLQTSFGKEPVIVEADRVQLQQVLLNFAYNAIDAMVTEGSDERILRIESRRCDADRIAILVSDTGPGVGDDPERLFDPLYSTKTEGMGLGLAICRRIVKAHRGEILIRTNNPRGAVFEFRIPIATVAS